MRITLKLFATLAGHLPAGARRNAAPLELPPGSSLEEALGHTGVPLEQVHLVILNGIFVAPEARPGTRLHEGDVLALWPPVAGG